MKVAHWVLDATLAGGQAIALQATGLGGGSGPQTGFIVDGAGPLTDIAAERGIAVIPFGLPRTHQLWRARALARLLREHSIELLHVHANRPAQAIARIAGWYAGVPVLCHLHSNEPFNPNPLLRRVQQAVEIAAARLHGWTIAVCRSLARRAVRRGYPARRTLTLPNAVAEPARDELWRGPGNPPALGMIARLAPSKGQRDLLAIFPRLAERFPDLTLTFVGADNQSRNGAYRRELEAMLPDRLRDRVAFCGHADEPWRRLPRIDVVVLPSYTEGMPLVVLEAMARGIPVVATAVGGVPEAVTHGRTGLLVPAGHQTALADAITRLLSDPGRSAAFGSMARQRYESEFTLSRWHERLREIYDTVGDDR